MTQDDNQQILHNGLQQTSMLEAEMVHRDKYGAIRELAEKGVPKKAIARALGVHVKTVRKYLKQGQWSPYQREPKVYSNLQGQVFTLEFFLQRAQGPYGAKFA